MGGEGVNAKAIQNVLFREVKPIGKQQKALREAGQDPSLVDFGSKSTLSAEFSTSRSDGIDVFPLVMLHLCTPHTPIDSYQKSPSTLEQTAHLKELASSFVRSRMMRSASAPVLYLVVTLRNSTLALVLGLGLMVRNFSLPLLVVVFRTVLQDIMARY